MTISIISQTQARCGAGEASLDKGSPADFGAPLCRVRARDPMPPSSLASSQLAGRQMTVRRERLVHEFRARLERALGPTLR